MKEPVRNCHTARGGPSHTLFPTIAGFPPGAGPDRTSGFGRRRLRAVIFDLDGTLADTAADIATALNAVLALRNLPPIDDDDAVKRMIGDGSRILIERAFHTLGAALDEGESDRLLGPFIAAYPAGAGARSRPYPGVVDALERLKAAGVAMGVCTNKPQGPAELLVADLGIAHYFGALIGGDRLAVRKPHPDHLLAVLEKLAVDPSAAAMVGDGPQDVAAARNARMPVIAFASGYGTVAIDRLAADAIARSFADIPDLLAALP